MRSLSVPALACLVALGLAACSPATPTTTPSTAPQPTFQCTPEAGGTPSPCTERQHEDMVAKDALYAEAERVERDFIAYFNTAQRLGGSETLPADLERYLVGNARTAVEGILRDQKQSRTRVVGELTKIVFIRRNVAEVVDGSAVSLAVCTDDRHVHLIRDGVEVGTGRMGLEKHYFTRVDGQLKLSDSRFLEGDPSCA